MKFASTIARKVVRVLVVLLGIALLLFAVIGFLSAFFMIGFGGFLSRMQGWETVTGSLMATGIGITCLRYKPKFGIEAVANDEEKQEDPLPTSTESSSSGGGSER